MEDKMSGKLFVGKGLTLRYTVMGEFDVEGEVSDTNGVVYYSLNKESIKEVISATHDLIWEEVA